MPFLDTDKNCLSYWFPKVAELGIQVPKTKIIEEPQATHLLYVMEGGPKEAFDKATIILDKLCIKIHDATEELGIKYPVFLRTGQTSAKHYWNRTCCVDNINAIGDHILQIVEFSELACIVGLKYDVWVVREMLNPRTWFLGFQGSMPINTELRIFAEDGEVVCCHPYWPERSILQPHSMLDHSPIAEENWKILLSDMFYDTLKIEKEAKEIASKVTKHIGGAWSVDCLLDRKRGVFLTDMALAPCSFHWDDCPHNRWNHE